MSGHKISGVTSTVNIMTKILVYYNNYYALNNFSRKAISFMKTLRNTMIKIFVNFPETECTFGLADTGSIPIQRQRDVATGSI